MSEKTRDCTNCRLARSLISPPIAVWPAIPPRRSYASGREPRPGSRRGMDMSGFFNPAAVKTSIISSEAMIALATSCRTAWSRSSPIIRSPVGLANAARTAWKNEMSSRSLTASSSAAQSAIPRKIGHRPDKPRLAVLLLQYVLWPERNQPQSFGQRADPTWHGHPARVCLALSSWAGSPCHCRSRASCRSRLRASTAPATAIALTDNRRALAAFSIHRQRSLQLIGQTKVVHH